MSAHALPAALRLVLAHKQRTSARLRFLRLPHGISAFEPLPDAAAFDEDPGPGKVVLHPQCGLQAAERHLRLIPGTLKPESEFAATLRSPAGAITVHLALIATEDPPFAAAAAVGGRFVTITEARDVHPLELELLRRAYTTLMG